MGERVASDLSRLKPQWVLRQRSVTIPATSTVQLVEANPLRWGLLIALDATAGAAGPTMAFFPDVLVPPGTGFNLSNTAPLILNYRASPALTQSSWSCQNPAATAAVAFVVEELAQV